MLDRVKGIPIRLEDWTFLDGYSTFNRCFLLQISNAGIVKGIPIRLEHCTFLDGYSTFNKKIPPAAGS
jgi:hypothetical protein